MQINLLLRKMAFFCSIILCIVLLQTESSHAQKRICVIGSSSAYGYFGNPSQYSRDSAWTFKLKKYYKEIGKIDTLFNLAVIGTDPYSGMPTSFIPPAGRELPDPRYNITKAVCLNPKPDVIIVNYPTNHYDYMSPAEIINCLRTIKDSANANNILCFITTTQPRDGFSPVERQKLKDLRDLIEATFGFWSIDFYTDITSVSNLKIKPEYALGDSVHLNPAGHTVLFNKVLGKDILFSPVPVVFESIEAGKEGRNNRILWRLSQDILADKFIIQKSRNGISFENMDTVLSVQNSDLHKLYAFTDKQNTGNCFYRIIAVLMNGNKKYSTVVAVSDSKEEPAFFPSIATNAISFLSPVDAEKMMFKIFTADGKKVFESTAAIKNHFPYLIPVSSLAPGIYFLHTQNGSEIKTYRFIKK